MRTDSHDVSSLVSYLNDIKPFHSKLTDVVVEYQANDNLFAKILDKSSMSVKMSSVWELEYVSDGRRVQYRIPAAVFPRYSNDFHQCVRKGVLDEVPGVVGAYFVPANNGVEVSVNGLVKQLGFDYSLNETRTVVQFLTNFPKQNDRICLNWAVVDRVFIGIEKTTYEYISAPDGIDMFRYEESAFDSSISTYDLINWKEYDLISANQMVADYDNIDQLTYDDSGFALFSPPLQLSDIEFKPYGHVKVLTQEKNKSYYVFEFNNPLPLNTRIYIRVEQREAYNGWTQTSIAEAIAFADIIRLYDTVNVEIADPGTWDKDEFDSGLDNQPFNFGLLESNRRKLLFGIDINAFTENNFDIAPFDTLGFDSISSTNQLGYYRLFHIHEQLADSIDANFKDSYRDLTALLYGDLYTVSLAESEMLHVGLLPNDIALTSMYDHENPLRDFDVSGFDGALFDGVETNGIFDIGLTNNKTKEITGARFTDSLSINDGLTTTSVYTPDAFGVVYVANPANRVEINHNFGYLPIVRVYQNAVELLPWSVDYPTTDKVIVNFTLPRTVAIRLT
jgi:hypothetical protein